jgi:DNA-binding beta-propeller fold protein YncE
MLCLSAVVGALALCCGLLPATALGADSVYWGDLFANHVSFAPLDGQSAPSNVPFADGVVQGPFGVTIDSAAGRIFWANSDAHQGRGAIDFANLDGSDVHELRTGNAPVAFPVGIAVDPVAGLVWWANADDNSIAFAQEDNSNVGDKLKTGAATVSGPSGIAIDPAGGLVYWANRALNQHSIAFAKTDNSNVGQNLKTGNAPVTDPFGIALDPVAGRVYWANNSANTIAWANVDNSDVGDRLMTGDATVSAPLGVAVDPAAGRIYWGNAGVEPRISFATPDGTGRDLIKDSNPGGASFPVLLAPSPVGTPAIAGAAAPLAVLSCSTGTWAPDLVGSYLYRAPQSFSYQWSRNGADIPGATQGSVASDPAGGDYRCRVTATNHAGSAAQTSAAVHIPAAPPGPGPGPGAPPGPLQPAFAASTHVSLALAVVRAPARGPVVVRIANANAFAVRATLSAQTTKPLASSHGRRVKLATKRLTIPAHAKRTISLSLPAVLRRVLASQRRLSLALTLVVTDPAGHRRTVKATVAPRLQVAKRPR